MAKRSHKLLFIAKLAIGLTLLATLLLWNDNWREVIQIFKTSRTEWIVPFIGISIVLMWVSCLKWKLFLQKEQKKISQLRLMVLYIIGMFFNNFLPSTVGGDVVRSYMLGKQIESQGQAMASVFLERLTGFIAMVTFAIGAFIFNPTLRSEPLVLISILIMGGGCLGVLIAIGQPALISRILGPLNKIPSIQGIEEKIGKFHGYVVQFKDKKALLAWAMLLSYLFYACSAVNVFFAAKLLGVETIFLQLLVVTPIIMLVAAMPLTPNSIGVWEWAFSVFLVAAGTTSQEGLAIAFALRSKDLVFSLVGGLFFLFERSKNSEKEGISIPEPK